MLEVKDVKFQPDGRLVVDTIGVSRFRVLSHGHRDGYNTAKIKHLEDQKVEGEELAELQKLHDCVYEQASTWFTSLKDNMKNQIVSHFGQLPEKYCDIQVRNSQQIHTVELGFGVFPGFIAWSGITRTL
jgi:Lon protease-like protein